MYKKLNLFKLLVISTVFFSGVFFSGVFFSGVAHADPTPTPKPNNAPAPKTFAELEESSRLHDARSWAASSRTFNAFSRFLTSNPTFYKYTRNASAFCTGESCEETGGVLDGVTTDPLVAGENKHSLQFYNPMGGFADTMNSKAHVNQLSKLLTSPASLYGITLFMTEPGVAAGATEMYQFANASLNNRYAAERQLQDQLNANPETKEILGRAYNECINQKMLGSGAGGKNALPWIQAQSECMGDRVDALNKEDTFPELKTASEDTALNFGFDPSHKKNNRWIGADDVKLIKLSEYIMGQDWKNNTDKGREMRENLKNDWLKIIGDYEFKFTAKDGDKLDWKNSALNVVFKKISATQKPEDLYKERTMEVYKKLLYLIRWRCDWENKHSEAPIPDEEDVDTTKDDTSPREDDEKDDFNNDFWSNNDSEGDTILLNQLSFKGSPATSFLMDNFYQYFKNPFRPEVAIKALEGDSSSKKKLLCDELLEGPVIDSGYPTDTGESGDRLMDSYKLPKRELEKINEYEKIYFSYARIVAMGQILGTLISAQHVVESLTNSTYDGFVRTFATRLIRESSGIEDLLGAHEQLLVEMRKLLEEVYARRAREVGAESGNLVKTGGARGETSTNVKSSGFTN